MKFTIQITVEAAIPAQAGILTSELAKAAKASSSQVLLVGAVLMDEEAEVLVVIGADGKLIEDK